MQTDEFRALVECDEHHWWYAGRRRVIHAQLARLDVPEPARVLDAGCGSGRTMDDLARYGRVSGFDLNELGVAHARERGHEDVVVARLEDIPHPDEAFDLVTCLDVIEHTPDDGRSLRELLRVTRPGGHLLVTVPAYQLLWSSHDVANRHYRRYRRHQLERTAERAGWEPVSWSYFNFILLPAGALVRLGERLRRPEKRRGRPNVQLTPRALDPVLEWPLRVEATAIRAGVPLPAGMSLMMAFRRPQAAPRENPQLAASAVNNL